LSNRKNFNIELLDKLPHNVVLVWLEIIVVWLLRWDFSIKSVGENLHFCDKLFKQTREIVEQLKFTDKWKNLLRSSFPEYKNNIDEYFWNEKMWFNHSWQVYNTSLNLKTKFRDSLIDTSIIEFISIFHDIWKFFQKLHSAENINIAIDIFKKFAEKNNLNSEILHKTLDWIKNSDFYNYRLDPLQNPPIFIEWKIVRCADKMQNNLVEKVDRYWFDYWVPRWAVFYDENISLEERGKFNFNNFLWDQLNVILSIIWLRPEDFYDEILNNEYTKWSKPEKERVVNRILSLTEELWYSKNEIKNIKEIIDWYRNKFSC
jgi:hypothetical protein